MALIYIVNYPVVVVGLELLHSTALSLLGSGKSEKVSLMYCLGKGGSRGNVGCN